MARRTAIWCVALAACVAAAGFASGRSLLGTALAAGLLVGAGNGALARRSLGADAGFRLTSLARLAALTAVGIGVAAMLGIATFPFVMAGIGVAQLVLAAVAARTALEARP